MTLETAILNAMSSDALHVSGGLDETEPGDRDGAYHNYARNTSQESEAPPSRLDVSLLNLTPTPMRPGNDCF